MGPVRIDTEEEEAIVSSTIQNLKHGSASDAGSKNFYSRGAPKDADGNHHDLNEIDIKNFAITAEGSKTQVRAHEDPTMMCDNFGVTITDQSAEQFNNASGAEPSMLERHF